MKVVLALLLVVGAFFIVTGMYEQKIIDAVARQSRVEYRFIPRSTYEEQMDATAVSAKNVNMFRDAPLATGGRTI